MRLKLKITQVPRGLPASTVESFPSPEHARWGQPSTALAEIKNSTTVIQSGIPTLTHPDYDDCIDDWCKWRSVFKGGDKFIEEYLQKFSKRETEHEFNRRKAVTPSPAFAKGAITEIKNAIFQRMADTARVGGPDTYIKSIEGLMGGVDQKGATMNWFIGHYIIPELLTMKKVGVWVDAPDFGVTLADKGEKHPYFYRYQAEHIRNWKYADNGSNREFESVLLRDFEYTLDSQTGLPNGQRERFRYVWIAANGFVQAQYYDSENKAISPVIELKITKIPFVVFEISDSLLKDVANAQIALLNLESSDISYALKGNFPFYTEQFDDKANAGLVKQAREAYDEVVEGTAITQHQLSRGTDEIDVGATQGRRYPKGMDRPGFISPSAEPLRVSMEKQQNLKADIRQLVHLALSTIQPKMASAESKSFDQQGLESGLSYIGLELEHGERQLASYWTMYEGKGQDPTIHYPKQWSLKSFSEIKDEVVQLQTMREDVPSLTFKKQINIRIANLVLGTALDAETLATIELELKTSKVASSDSAILTVDLENGLIDQKTASLARGYPEGTSDQAAVDHAERLARIQQSQTAGNPAARGIPELDPLPTSGSTEKLGKAKRGESQ